MNTLRRRTGALRRGETPSREETPDSEDLRVVSAKKLHRLTHQPPGRKRKMFWIFVLGGLFGLVLAAFFANNSDLIDLASLVDVNLETLMDVLPAGLIKDAKEFQVSGLESGTEYVLICSAGVAT